MYIKCTVRDSVYTMTWKYYPLSLQINFVLFNLSLEKSPGWIIYFDVLFKMISFVILIFSYRPRCQHTVLAPPYPYDNNVRISKSSYSLFCHPSTKAQVLNPYVIPTSCDSGTIEASVFVETTEKTRLPHLFWSHFSDTRIPMVLEFAFFSSWHTKAHALYWCAI